jgi:hypothetical protein
MPSNKKKTYTIGGIKVTLSLDIIKKTSKDGGGRVNVGGFIRNKMFFALKNLKK